MRSWCVRFSLLLPLTALLAAACGTTPTRVAGPAPHAVAPAPRSPAPTHLAQRPTASPYPLEKPWKLGTPLPLRADGFGQVLPTPTELRNRRFATTDVLPAPTDGLFHSSVGLITPALAHRMAGTHRAGCPVPLTALRYLNVSFRGFDGRAHTGEIVVAATVASPVVQIFRSLYDVGFPIEQMRLATAADETAHPTGDGNDTVGFACTVVPGSTHFSAHAYGLAIDVNPFQNPEKKGDLVIPELASAYTVRAWVRPGMLLPGSPAVRAFARAGWTWGGTWHSLKDYMHFSQTGF
jgi:hypothetical protein